MIPDFLEWHGKHSKYVQSVTKLLSIPLNDEPEVLIQQAEEIETHNARIGFLLADANGWLDKAKMYYQPAKDEGRSEADRKILLDAEISSIRIVRDKLESLQDSIRQRLILSESLLAYHRQFRERVISSSVGEK